jgi:hypothetical protein
MALSGGREIGSYAAKTKEACCAICREVKLCVGSAFHPNHTGDGGCVLRKGPLVLKPDSVGVVCVSKPTTTRVDGESSGQQQQQLSDMDWVIDETDTQ